jgi:hypothetical protein
MEILDRQGGFKIGDTVEVKMSNKWRGSYIICNFKSLKVEVYNIASQTIKSYPSARFWVSIFDVRHPRLIKHA